MLLKRLELQGLKSFADKTVLDLGNNITAIVGPNGSGKSNITDSIRWLLGERDARNLRGAKGEDLIFAGTESRPRMGLAQATIYFDNSSGFFPIEFKEVSISRRISREGTSQFYINKSEVRLKDLIDFLARVKLGARGLTVINQGQSDTFIAASPTERREMVEEILGLKEYQLKKSDAERKLKNTSYNLEKAYALIEELKPHLRLLRKQSSRYENRERIAGELFELENIFYGSRLMRLREALKRLSKEEEDVDKKISEEQPEFQKIEKEFNEINESEPETSKTLGQIKEKKQKVLLRKAEFERNLGRIEAKLEFQSQESLDEDADLKAALKKIKAIAEDSIKEDDITRIKSMAGKVVQIVEGLFVSAGGGESLKDDAQKEYKKLLGDIESFNRELEILDKEEKSHQESLEGFNKNFRDAYEKVESARKKHESLVSEKNKLELEKEKVGLKLSSLKEELNQIGRSVASLENTKERSESGETLIDEDAAMSRMFKLRQELASIGDIDESIINEAKETEERNSFLGKQIDDLEKAIADLALLIKELDEKIYTEFNSAMKAINIEFEKMIKVVFGGGRAKLIVRNRNNHNSTKQEKNIEDEEETTEEPEEEEHKEGVGIDVEISLPQKKVKGLDVLSGGERSLVSIAALFALISVSPPPFLVLDEVDAALDEKNAKRFGQILEGLSKKTQFVIITHNRATMETAGALYGVTMSQDGTSKLVSLKLE